MKLLKQKPAVPMYSVHCKFCGKQIIDHPGLDLMVNDSSSLAQDILAKEIRHMQKHHDPEYKQGAAFMDGVMSFVVMSAFEHQDPSVNPRLELIRAGLFERVKRTRLNDDDLRTIVNELGIDDYYHDRVLKALTAIRDALSETGKYAPGQQSEPSPLILT
jgi:hypothetical protein